MHWIYWVLLLLLSAIIFLLIGLLLFKRLSSKRERAYQAKYPSSYLCIDGHKVRSLSELIIDDLFYRWGIHHEYEDFILQSFANYKYDWYLPDFDLYLEFFGYSGKKYQQTKREKEEFYRRHHLHMIALEPSDLADIQSNIVTKLKSYIGTDLLVHHCPHCGKSLDSRL
jgi:hypothetical protein